MGTSEKVKGVALLPVPGKVPPTSRSLISYSSSLGTEFLILVFYLWDQITNTHTHTLATILSDLHILHLILTRNLCSRYYYSHFKDAKILHREVM